MDWPDDDHALAALLAQHAGEVLVALRDRLQQQGAMGWQVMDEGDAASHHYLMASLIEARPHDAILSEEGRDNADRLSAERVWIIDPLDGTNEYGEGRTDWAVHVALVREGSPIAAAVSLPAIGRTFATEPVTPFTPAPADRPLRLIASRTRASEATLVLAAELGAEVVRLGSAGAKTMAVLTGEVDIYAHTGGMYEWDSCAPAAVARSAGLHVSRIDGSPLVYNNPDPWLPDLLVCRPELADRVFEVLWT